MGKVIEIKDFSAIGSKKLKPAEELAKLVMAEDEFALEYARKLKENADGKVSIAVFINRCQRNLELARHARKMFSSDLYLGPQVGEAFEHASKQFKHLSPTVIEARIFNNKKLVKNFGEIGRYSKHNPEIQFIYDMLRCPQIEGDVTYFARQVDYAIGRMYADGRFSDKEILETAARCSVINDSMETLMLPIMLLRDALMRKDKAFVAQRVAEGMDVETAIEICKKQMQHRPGDAEYYDEIREHVRRKESSSELA